MTTRHTVSGRRRLLGLAMALLGMFMVLGAGRAAHSQESAAPAQKSQSVQKAQGATAAEAQPGSQAEPADEKGEYRLSASTLWLAKVLHMDPKVAALLFDLLNFAILFGAIGVTLKRVLPKMFRERGVKLEGQLTEARAATLDANHRLEVVEGRLSRLDDEIIGLRGRAEGEMRAEEERFRASLEQEKARILENAEQEISAATANARRELKRLAADLAVANAERNLNLTAEQDHAMVHDFAQMLGTVPNGSNN